MLNEMMSMLVKEFEEKQNALISAIGGDFKAILINMKKIKTPKHGKPPYILDDGEVALLFITKDGNYSKLPPGFSLSEETISRDYEVIYTLPVHGIGSVRFIPARADMATPDAYQSNFAAPAYSPQFLDSLGKYLGVMSNTVPKLAAFRMAKKLIQLQPAMESSAKEAEMSLESFMQLREVRDAFVSALGEAFVEGAKRASEMVVEAGKESA